tara:strand:+ start:669 stop:842 length:174 start_codon:yes stop_codon:yes gene_type:complete
MGRKLVRLDFDIDRLINAKALAWDLIMEEAREQGMQKQLKEILNIAYSRTEPSKGYK